MIFGKYNDYKEILKEKVEEVNAHLTENELFFAALCAQKNIEYGADPGYAAMQALEELYPDRFHFLEFHMDEKDRISLRETIAYFVEEIEQCGIVDRIVNTEKGAEGILVNGQKFTVTITVDER